MDQVIESIEKDFYCECCERTALVELDYHDKYCPDCMESIYEARMEKYGFDSKLEEYEDAVENGTIDDEGQEVDLWN